MNQAKLKEKRSLRLRLTLLYTCMVVAVLLLVGGIYLIIQGYRFNRFEGQLEQGGLVQFNSFPTGASLWLNGEQLDKKTQSKLTISAGTHKFSMWREGYHDWNVQRTVVPGAVLWLNYTRLVPKDLKIDTQLQLAGIASHATSYDNKTIAMVEDSARPAISLLQIGTDTAAKSQVVLPATLYSTQNDHHTFSVVAWARDNAHVLVKHEYSEGVEWLSVNTANVEVSKNITHLLGVDALDMQYSDDTNILFALTPSGEVRRINVGQNSLSGPLVTGVSNFSLYDSNTVVYATTPNPKGVRTVGYMTVGAASPRIVAEYTAPAAADQADISYMPLTMRISKYAGSYYLAIASGTNVQVLTGELTASDTKTPPPFKEYTEFTMDSNANWLGFSPDSHRFVYAQSERGVVTYDLDMKAKYTTYVPSISVIDWIDEFHFTAVANGALTMYDFDGSNPQPLIVSAINNTAVLLQSGRYLYGLQDDEQQSPALVRLKMTVN